MELQRVGKEPVHRHPADDEEVVFTGRLNEKEIRLAQNDPTTFLKAAEISVPDDAEIRVSVHNFSTAAARRVSGGLLCRVTITCCCGFCVIEITCIPVVIVSCW